MWHPTIVNFITWVNACQSHKPEWKSVSCLRLSQSPNRSPSPWHSELASWAHISFVFPQRVVSLRNGRMWVLYRWSAWLHLLLSLFSRFLSLQNEMPSWHTVSLSWWTACQGSHEGISFLSWILLAPAWGWIYSWGGAAQPQSPSEIGNSIEILALSVFVGGNNLAVE